MAESSTRLQTVFGETPKTEYQRSFREAMGLREPYIQQTARARQDLVKAEGDVLQAQQRQLEQKAAGETLAKMQYAQDESAAQEAYKEAKAAEPIPAFVPTRDNAEDLAKLFSFIGVMGTFLGRGGGKQAAMGAMAGMTGMMEGWRQGRMDLYNQEKVKFEKDFARVNKIHQDLAKDLENALRTAATNKEVGLSMANEAAVKAGSDIVRQTIATKGIAASVELAKEISASANTVIAEVNKREAEDRRNRATVEASLARATGKPTKPDIWMLPSGEFIDASKEPYYGVPPKGARKPAAVEAGARAESRLSAADEARERKAAELSPPERKEYRGLKNLSDEIQLLADTFKPEYANFVFDKAGDIAAKFQARIADDPGMAEWWRRYKNVEQPERHSLFGATLTGLEREDWRKASIGAGSSTAEVLSWIADKERVMGKKIDLLLKPVPTRGEPKPASPAPSGSRAGAPGTPSNPIKLD